jgi:tryptophan-rich sensory protein
MRRAIPFIVFTGLIFAVGFTAAAFSMPGQWYAQLNKPWFNPPSWVFGPVWTTLYVLIGIAGAIAWNSSARAPLTALWLVQLVLNGAWSIAFFRMQMPGLALVVILGMLAAIVGFILYAWRPARLAALLFLPYAAWVAFAGILNATIVALN